MTIRKIRTVPRKYTPIDIVWDYPIDTLRAFPYLYLRFGTPLKSDGLYRYMLRYKNVVLDIKGMVNGLNVVCYISPMLRLRAERIRVKVLNVLAHDVIAKGCVFCPDGKIPDYLYFATKQKNNELLQKTAMDTDRFYEVLGDGRRLLEAPLRTFVPEVESVIGEMVHNLMEERYHGITIS